MKKLPMLVLAQIAVASKNMINTNLTPKYAYKICSFSGIHYQKTQTEQRL